MLTAYPFAGSLVLDPGGDSPLALLNPRARATWANPSNRHEAEAVAAALVRDCGWDEKTARASVTPAWDNRRLDDHLDPGLAPAPQPDQPPSRTEAALASGRGRRRVYRIGNRAILVRYHPASLETTVGPRFEHIRDDGARPVAELTLGATAGSYVLREPGAPDLLCPHAQALLGAFVRRFVELCHPECRWRAVLHAAAIGSPERGAVLLPGASGSGKSTLTAGLVAAGHGYLSDDCVPIDQHGRAVPVPFALCLKEGSWPAASSLTGLAMARTVRGHRGLRCRYVAVARICAGPAALRVVVFPRFRALASTSLRPMSPEAALRELIATRAWLSRSPEDLQGTLAILEQVPAFELVYGDLGQAVALVSGLA